MSSPDPQSIIALYEHINDEVKEQRNERWRLTLYFSTLAVGTILLTKEESLFGEAFGLFQVLALLCVCFSLPLYIWLILRSHFYLLRSRRIRRSIENHLNLGRIYEDNQRTSVLPPAWQFKTVSAKFEFIDIVFPMIAYTVGCQIIAIIALL